MGLNLDPIGTAYSSYPTKFGVPRQPGLVNESLAFLQLNSSVQPHLSLQGLENFSHIWVLFHFHSNTNQTFHAKVHPPRLDGKAVGLFATRSPHRPNPIGLSLVRIHRILANGIWVFGLDVVDGTPFFDLKPYIPSVEAVFDARSTLMEEKDKTASATSELAVVTWSEEAKKDLQIYCQLAVDRLRLGETMPLALVESIRIVQDQPDPVQALYVSLQKQIHQNLILDPRPRLYKNDDQVGYDHESSRKYRSSHAMRYLDADVHFRFKSDAEILVDRWLTYKDKPNLIY